MGKYSKIATTYFKINNIGFNNRLSWMILSWMLVQRVHIFSGILGPGTSRVICPCTSVLSAIIDAVVRSSIPHTRCSVFMGNVRSISSTGPIRERTRMAKNIKPSILRDSISNLRQKSHNIKIRLMITMITR